jgi:peptidoglycan/xylan/chitin deacetylase (PgdA/CDA1 family)
MPHRHDAILVHLDDHGCPRESIPALRRRERTRGRAARLAVPALLPLLIVAALLGRAGAGQAPSVERVEGGIVRGPVDGRRIALVFTGHEFAEGAGTILDALAKRSARASFFLTGAFLRDPAKAGTVRRMIADGHYVGPHSDAHLLYCPWTGPKVTLVSRDEFTRDLQRNVDALERHGVAREAVTFFLPPYEWYNAEIAEWTRALGMTLVNYTPGTRSNADYTEEGTRQFVSSEVIFQSIVRREREDPHGLNGFLLLLHVGAGPGRTDKFHARFDELLEVLAARGYAFVRVDELLAR